MKVIPREAGRTTYSTEMRALKKSLVLSEYQKAIVIGTILGDGCLCDNWSKTNYRLKMSHSIKQQEYVLWKYSVLKNWILTEPKIHEKTKSITIRTISHPELTDLHAIFYQDKKKIIPQNIEDLLSPIALAVWFMDDGNAVRHKSGDIYAYNLNTQSFDRPEHQILIKVLRDKFDLHPNINKNNGSLRLYIGVKDKINFANLIKDYIVPSMQYKIG